MKIKITILLTLLSIVWEAPAQENVIDQVVAVVGSEMIMLSDIENQYLQFRLQGNTAGGAGVRCNILENLLFQKLLLNQAQLDSVEVTESMVDQEMDRKLRYFISQIGSREKLEEYYKKSIIEIKEEFKDLIRDQLMVEMMKQNITGTLKVTPSEVKAYFKAIPNDSLPLINSEVELGHIVKEPPVNPEEIKRIMEKLNVFRERIINGESFAALAALYSEDPGSAKKGGEVGMVGRGELFPEFEAVAFGLKKGEVSEIVETDAGFHIVRLIERRGEYVNVKHILLMPKASPTDLAKAQKDLDNISSLIEMDSITFEKAALKHSDDPSKNNGGSLVNPLTGTTKFETDQLDPSIFFVIDKMEVGDVSAPVVMRTEEGKQAYRIIYLVSRTDPHRANMKDDYNKLQEWALEEKRDKAIQRWISRKTQDTYINIIDNYQDCNFSYEWVNW